MQTVRDVKRAASGGLGVRRSVMLPTAGGERQVFSLPRAGDRLISARPAYGRDYREKVNPGSPGGLPARRKLNDLPSTTVTWPTIAGLLSWLSTNRLSATV